MAKLILEEAGARRAFRMGNGVLTVGSGAEARLRLASPGVAEIHFELELSERGARLRPRPGVIPPTVAGAPVRSEVMLAPGKPVEVGGARLWLELEEDQAPAVAPRAEVAAPAPDRPRRSPVGERSRSTGRGFPTRAVIALILGTTAITLFVWWRLVQRRSEKGSSQALVMIQGAEQIAAAGDFDGARRKLAEIPPDQVTPEIGARVDELRASFEQRRVAVDTALRNEQGTKYLDSLLKKYEARYLTGTPEPAQVRLFLKRCRTFRERWPGHPDLDWVRRQEGRFEGFVDPDAPPTWADVQWEVKDLTDTSPRNYAAALALVDGFLEGASRGERTEAQGLRDKLVSERVEYAQDRLYQAKYEFEQKEDPSKAVWWLVHSVAWLGDEALANEAARFLVRMPDLSGHLLGYKESYPDRYQAVVRNPVVAAWARESGFKP